jgi:hypothetical protein
MREDQAEFELADLWQGRLDVRADEVLKLVEPEVRAVVLAARDRTRGGEDFVQHQRPDRVGELGGKSVPGFKIEDDDLPLTHEPTHVKPARRRPEHPPQDAALKVGLEPVAGRFQDAYDVRTLRVEKFFPLHHESRR